MKAPARKPKSTAQSPAPRRGGRRRSADAKRRRKISTTIAPEGYAFLKQFIESGKAVNLAEAIDMVLEESRRTDNRVRLERATAAYYESASDEAVAEENELAAALPGSLSDPLFDE